ncbi:MAG TPA: hypothetical protein DEB48_08110 [Verrucomicrobiales bacterium]|nr:hypothetical protein [Verrucomicrobiales bacterium]
MTKMKKLICLMVDRLLLKPLGVNSKNLPLIIVRWFCIIIFDRLGPHQVIHPRRLLKMDTMVFDSGSRNWCAGCA